MQQIHKKEPRGNCRIATMAGLPLSGISLDESCEVYEQKWAGEISGFQNQLAMHQTKVSSTIGN
jgi:hypothetical protein